MIDPENRKFPGNRDSRSYKIVLNCGCYNSGLSMISLPRSRKEVCEANAMVTKGEGHRFHGFNCLLPRKDLRPEFFITLNSVSKSIFTRPINTRLCIFK